MRRLCVWAMRLGWIAPIALVVLISACTSAVSMGISWGGDPYKEEKTMRGVVNGLWQHDAARNSDRLHGSFGKADDTQASALANRHLVRVGINRSYLFGRAIEFVVLPDSWTYSLAEVIDNGRTINVGDVVDTRTIVGTNLAEVVTIVRKCDAPTVPDENKDWNIGCKRVAGFDSHGYGGESYYLSGF